MITPRLWLQATTITSNYTMFLKWMLFSWFQHWWWRNIYELLTYFSPLQARTLFVIDIMVGNVNIFILLGIAEERNLLLNVLFLLTTFKTRGKKNKTGFWLTPNLIVCLFVWERLISEPSLNLLCVNFLLLMNYYFLLPETTLFVHVLDFVTVQDTRPRIFNKSISFYEYSD